MVLLPEPDTPITISAHGAIWPESSFTKMYLTSNAARIHQPNGLADRTCRFAGRSGHQQVVVRIACFPAPATSISMT